MTTPKRLTAQGEFRKDTAKGKKHFAVESNTIAGAIYLPPEVHKEIGSPIRIKVTVEAA